LDGGGAGWVAQIACTRGKYFLRFVELFTRRRVTQHANFLYAQRESRGGDAVASAMVSDGFGYAISQCGAKFGVLRWVAVGWSFEGRAIAQDQAIGPGIVLEHRDQR
jgi:hypothetical protein